MGVSPSSLPLKGLEVLDSNDMTYLESIVLNTSLNGSNTEYCYVISKECENILNVETTIMRSLYLSLFMNNHRIGIETIKRFINKAEKDYHIMYDDIYLKMMLRYRRFDFIDRNIVYQITNDKKNSKLNIGFIKYLLSNEVEGYYEEVERVKNKLRLVGIEMPQICCDNKFIIDEISYLFSSK